MKIYSCNFYHYSIVTSQSGVEGNKIKQQLNNTFIWDEKGVFVKKHSMKKYSLAFPSDCKLPLDLLVQINEQSNCNMNSLFKRLARQYLKNVEDRMAL